MYRRSLLLFLLALLLLPGGPAAAQGDTELARRYYKLGEELYNRSAYQEALEQFNKSYKHAQKPALLYNMARCHEPLGQHEQAIKLYEEYLTHNPPNAAKVQARITNLRKLVQQRNQPQPASQPAPAPVEGTAQPEPDEPLEPAPEELAPGPSGSRPLRIAGWVLVGVGVVGMATGIAMGALAADKASELEDLNAGGTTEYSSVESEASRGKQYQTGQIVGLAAGGALLATGVVLVVLDAVQAGKKEQRSAWLAPAPVRGGMVFGGGFSF